MPDSPTPAGTEARQERAESARLDNFVDGAFAFAITLLIISGGGLPHTVEELEQALRGVPAFAACFAQLAWFWHSHVSWRDNLRLTDRPSLLLSLLLVFFALIFVFPLHLVYAGAFNGLSNGVLSPGVATFGRDKGGAAALFVCYGLSYACMAGTLAALHWHGARTATRLARVEADSIRVAGVIWTYVASVGLLSTLLALTLPVDAGWVDGLPGIAYFLLALIGPIVHFYRKRLARRLTP
jgi:uncharacterized membrane protein